MTYLRDLSVAHRTVFLRVDFNVPLDDAGVITEDARIKAVLTTIEYLVQQKARVIIGSHLGRPDGAVVESMRLRPVAQRLEELLGMPVKYVEDCIGSVVDDAKAALADGEILLLENLRFHKGEEANDMHFAENLSQNIDVYINDAFGAIHRKHASVHALPSLIFDKGAGFLLEDELRALSRVAHQPEKPFAIIVGGMKLTDKVKVIEHLAPVADVVLVGGGVANTFLRAAGTVIGKSKIEAPKTKKDGTVKDPLQDAVRILETVGAVPATLVVDDMPAAKKVVLPVDVVVSTAIDAAAPTRVIDLESETVSDEEMILDIGPKTQALYAQIIGRAKTVFWNGPMGLFEQEAFRAGSAAVAKAVAESEAYSVLGGGDTESLISTVELTGSFSHVSTGGGASLAYVAGDSLPGIEILE